MLSKKEIVTCLNMYIRLYRQEVAFYNFIKKDKGLRSNHIHFIVFGKIQRRHKLDLSNPFVRSNEYQIRLLRNTQKMIDINLRMYNFYKQQYRNWQNARKNATI